VAKRFAASGADTYFPQLRHRSRCAMAYRVGITADFVNYLS